MTRRMLLPLTALACAGISSAVLGVMFLARHTLAQALDRFEHGIDQPVPVDGPPPLVVARARLLLSHGRADEAAALAERLEGVPEAEQARAQLLYALANDHARRALARFSTAPMRELAPTLALAKSEYRAALHIDPQNWDARYNLDIISALLRDAEPPPSMQGDEMARERAFAPDIPGAPNGMP